eukprot:566269-Pyramimonas_sp.AAC.1
MSGCELQRDRAALLSLRSPSHRGGPLLAGVVLRGGPKADARVAPAVPRTVAGWQALVASERSLPSAREPL